MLFAYVIHYPHLKVYISASMKKSYFFGLLVFMIPVGGIILIQWYRHLHGDRQPRGRIFHGG